MRSVQALALVCHQRALAGRLRIACDLEVARGLGFLYSSGELKGSHQRNYFSV
jgi:hypothetical protein